MIKTKNETPVVDTDVVDEEIIDDTRRTALKAKLKKFALIGGAALAVGGLVTIIVVKSRGGSDLPSITDALPTE